MRFALFIALLLTTLPISAVSKEDDFVSGEIIIGFHPHTEPKTALDLSKKFNLPIKGVIFHRNHYIFQHEQKDWNKTIRYLEQSKLFDMIDTQLDGNAEPNAVFAWLKLTATPQQVESLLANSSEPITIESQETNDIIILVSVKNGTEENWINKLSLLPDIEFVELNAITTIDVQ